MKIVGHRGAAGVALENTLESIRAAIKAGVRELEIDIRLTRDGIFVLSHDPDLRRVANSPLIIAESTLTELQAVPFPNGERIVTLSEALKVVEKDMLVIEAKNAGWANALVDALTGHEAKVHGVIAFNHRELAVFHKRLPAIRTYPLSLINPFSAYQSAKRHAMTGFGIGYWSLNPLVYHWGRKANLEVYVYTVNNVWLARVLKTLYPDISIATNYPEKLSTLV